VPLGRRRPTTVNADEGIFQVPMDPYMNDNNFTILPDNISLEKNSGPWCLIFLTLTDKQKIFTACKIAK
jgi:hypothetical protein